MAPRTSMALLVAVATAAMLIVPILVQCFSGPEKRPASLQSQAQQPSSVAAQAANRAAILALPGAFPRTAAFDFATPEPGSYTLPPIKNAPGATLLDHGTHAVELGAIWPGRISLVSFVYLTCTDENGCPLAMSVLYEIEFASRTHAALRDHTQLVTVSFDPARDTPAALAALVATRSRDIAERRVLPWRFLTGRSEEGLAPMLAAFGQRVDKEPNSERLNHLLRMYLVDGAGRIRNIYGLGTIDPRLIMADVATLLLEGATQ